MKILIEIPVEIDGPLTASERRKLREHLERGMMTSITQPLADAIYAGESRMLGTICRFTFGDPKGKVE